MSCAARMQHHLLYDAQATTVYSRLSSSQSNNLKCKEAWSSAFKLKFEAAYMLLFLEPWISGSSVYLPSYSDHVGTKAGPLVARGAALKPSNAWTSATSNTRLLNDKGLKKQGLNWRTSIQAGLWSLGVPHRINWKMNSSDYRYGYVGHFSSIVCLVFV